MEQDPVITQDEATDMYDNTTPNLHEHHHSNDDRRSAVKQNRRRVHNLMTGEVESSVAKKQRGEEKDQPSTVGSVDVEIHDDDNENLSDQASVSAGPSSLGDRREEHRPNEEQPVDYLDWLHVQQAEASPTAELEPDSNVNRSLTAKSSRSVLSQQQAVPLESLSQTHGVSRSTIAARFSQPASRSGIDDSAGVSVSIESSQKPPQDEKFTCPCCRQQSYPTWNRRTIRLHLIHCAKTKYPAWSVYDDDAIYMCLTQQYGASAFFGLQPGSTKALVANVIELFQHIREPPTVLPSSVAASSESDPNVDLSSQSGSSGWERVQPITVNSQPVDRIQYDDLRSVFSPIPETPNVLPGIPTAVSQFIQSLQEKQAAEFKSLETSFEQVRTQMFETRQLTISLSPSMPDSLITNLAVCQLHEANLHRMFSAARRRTHEARIGLLRHATINPTPLEERLRLLEGTSQWRIHGHIRHEEEAKLLQANQAELHQLEQSMVAAAD